MNLHDCLLVEQNSGWLLVTGEETQHLDANVSVQTLATCVRDTVQRTGVKKVNCLLAPASTSCFFATIDLGDEVDIRDRAALIYELEDHLPIDAESMVADFVEIDSPSEPRKMAASIAIEADRWGQIADALELAGVPVRSIVPAAVLVTRSICQGSNRGETILYVIVDETQCDLVTVCDESILGWKRCRVETTRLNRHKLLETPQPDRIVVVGAAPPQQVAIQDAFGVVELQREPLESYLVNGAKLALTNHSKRWFELRRDRLGPSDPLRPIQSHLRWATLSAVACLLVVVFGGWWREQRIESEINRIRGQQVQLFREAFPDSRIPGALLHRVRSEHARVLGSRGASAQIDVPASATKVLRALVAAFPRDLRFRVESIEIANGQVDLELQVRNPVDAGQLATSLTEAGFIVKPPVTTQRDAKTFDSFLEAVWSAQINPTADRQIDTSTLGGVSERNPSNPRAGRIPRRAKKVSSLRRPPGTLQRTREASG